MPTRDNAKPSSKFPGYPKFDIQCQVDHKFNIHNHAKYSKRKSHRRIFVQVQSFHNLPNQSFLDLLISKVILLNQPYISATHLKTNTDKHTHLHMYCKQDISS